MVTVTILSYCEEGGVNFEVTLLVYYLLAYCKLKKVRSSLNRKPFHKLVKCPYNGLAYCGFYHFLVVPLVAVEGHVLDEPNVD